MSRPPEDTKRQIRPAIKSKIKANGNRVYKRKNSDGSNTRTVIKKNGNTVTSKRKAGKTISKERNIKNADGSHKKTVSKSADGSKTVRKYKGGLSRGGKSITKTTDKAGNKTRSVRKRVTNKKGEMVSKTRTKTSSGVTKKREIYTKNKKGEAIVKTKTKGPNGKKTTSRRKQGMNYTSIRHVSPKMTR